MPRQIYPAITGKLLINAFFAVVFVLLICYYIPMINIKKTHIPGLYKTKRSDYEKIYTTLISAFKKYPKMLTAFPDDHTREAAIEATIRYYAAYDLRYGSGFSLDNSINEVAIIVHSDEMRYSFIRHLLSGSYSIGYKAAMNRLNKNDRIKRLRLFDELDRLEATVDIPRPHIYLDFLGVEEKHQHQGRGRKLMDKICKYADDTCLPIMLFTNTDEDIAFYQSLGFRIIGITHSEEFGFTNTYLLYGL